MTYDEAACALYQVPHGQFVEERKRLAAELKAAGDKLGASRISRLMRPPVTAWAVNQLYWHARDAMDAFFALASRLRDGDLSATAAHREALAKLRTRAAAILGDAGHGANEATLRRIALTLSNLAAAGTWHPDAPGQLGSDRDPPGFEAVGVINPPSAPLPVPEPPKKYDFAASQLPPIDELAAKREQNAKPPAGEIADVDEPVEETAPEPAAPKRSALDELAARRKKQRDDADEERRRKFIEDGGSRDAVIAKRMREADQRNREATDAKRERVETAVRAKLDEHRAAKPSSSPAKPPEPPRPPARPPQATELVDQLAADLGAPKPRDLAGKLAAHLGAPPAKTVSAPPPAPANAADQRKRDARAKLKAELEARLRTATAEAQTAEQRVEKLTAELADADDALEKAREAVEDLRDKLDAID